MCNSSSQFDIEGHRSLLLVTWIYLWMALFDAFLEAHKMFFVFFGIERHSVAQTVEDGASNGKIMGLIPSMHELIKCSVSHFE